MKKYNYCIFIGRFSIFHKGHAAILDQALSLAEKVIVVIGSASAPRSVRNPWTASERQEMISLSLPKDKLERIIFVNMKDYLYNNNLWISVLQQKISTTTNDSENVALIGFESDETSFYLKLFPQFTYIDHGIKYNFHATNIRDKYFSHDFSYKEMVPEEVSKFLENFKEREEFKSLYTEKKYIDQYIESWRGAPKPVLFCTVDSLVIKSGHLLLIKRGRNPGKGLFAMPGGFLNQKEKLEDAALRELIEETKIKVDISDLRKSIITSKVFDEPTRSSRGRVLTHTFLIDLGIGALPKITPGDDASGAEWLPLSDFYSLESSFFEDHFHIIRNMLGKHGG